MLTILTMIAAVIKRYILYNLSLRILLETVQLNAMMCLILHFNNNSLEDKILATVVEHKNAKLICAQPILILKTNLPISFKISQLRQYMRIERQIMTFLK
jgi:predicted transcriptional regulator